MRPVVLIRDRDEVAVSRPAFIFTTKLLELSASQRILTEVQQCCAILPKQLYDHPVVCSKVTRRMALLYKDGSVESIYSYKIICSGWALRNLRFYLSLLCVYCF